MTPSSRRWWASCPSGTEDSGPTRLGTPIVDIATGLFSAIAILMAVVEREKSGRGQYCDMTLHDCGMALLHPHAAIFFLNGKRPVATGNPHPNLAPYAGFTTRACGSLSDAAMIRPSEVLRLPGPGRAGHRSALRHQRPARDQQAGADGDPQQRFAGEDGHDLCQRMRPRAYPPAQSWAWMRPWRPRTAHRNMVTEKDGFVGLGTPIKLSRTPGGTRAAPPRFGQHTQEVLARLGFSEAEIAGTKPASWWRSGASERRSSMSLAEIREADAPPEVAAIMASCGQAYGLPLVNLIWRAFPRPCRAFCPGPGRAWPPRCPWCRPRPNAWWRRWNPCRAWPSAPRRHAWPHSTAVAT